MHPDRNNNLINIEFLKIKFLKKKSRVMKQKKIKFYKKQ
jgi:hypothetical protein